VLAIGVSYESPFRATMSASAGAFSMSQLHVASPAFVVPGVRATAAFEHERARAALRRRVPAKRAPSRLGYPVRIPPRDAKAMDSNEEQCRAGPDS
jgi:hypothetical protein